MEYRQCDAGFAARKAESTLFRIVGRWLCVTIGAALGADAMAAPVEPALAHTSATTPPFVEQPLTFGKEELEFIVGVFAWVDHDADGWLDLMVSGLWTDATAVRFARNNRDGTFTLRDSGITNFYASTVSFGDYDRDGILDLLMTGTRPQVHSDWPLATRIYRGNAAGTFTMLPEIFPGVIGNAHWGDFNNDGALDVLVVGRDNNSAGSAVTRIYRNDGSGRFTDIEAGLPPRGDDFGSRWIDFNGDGFLDVGFQITYWENSVPLTVNQYYRNRGDGTFATVPVEVPVSQPKGARGDFDNDGSFDLLHSDGALRVYRGSEAGLFTNLAFYADIGGLSRAGWGDYDKDGDLDFFVSDGSFGGGAEGSNFRRLFRNGTTSSNIPPAAPSGLMAAVGTNNRVVLTWSGASDATTPGSSLTYDVRVGTTPGGREIVAPLWTASGALRLAQPGTIATTNRVLQDIPRGTYYWSVRAIDAGFAGSELSSEGSFSITKPQILPVAGHVTPPSIPITVPILVSDLETPAGLLRLSGTSADQTLVPDGNIVFGGNGSNRTMTITPAPGQRGVVPITVTLVDGDGYTDTETFPLHVEIFTRTTEFPAVGAIGKTAFGDYNNDGWMDFVIVDNTAGTVVWRNNGDGTFTNAITLPPGIGSAAWGDYDNDDDLDLLLTGLSLDGYPRTRIFRNDNANVFTEAATSLMNLFGIGVWGDVDGDGDLDVLLSGYEGPPSHGFYTVVYRNDAGAFREITNSLPGVQLPGAAFSDFDNDGDLDLLLTGDTGGPSVAHVYRNDGSGRFSGNGQRLSDALYHGAEGGNFDNDAFADILIAGNTTEVYRNTHSGGFERLPAAFPGVARGAATWGDVDNDGWLDLLLAGAGSTKVLRNDKNSGFSDLAAEIPNLHHTSGGWIDADSDGDLDVLLFGMLQDNISAGRPGYIYRNNSAASNTPPSAPEVLQARAISPANDLKLTWAASDDEQTPANGLTYNVRLGTTPGGHEIISSHSSASNGQRRIPASGNAGHIPTKVVSGLADGVYYWSVQSIDTAFAGSPFAPEQMISFFRPTISAMPDLELYPGSGPVAVPFRISDADAEPDSLALSVSVSNTNLFPAAHFSFSGSGTNRTLTFSPAAGLTGSATITVVVTDTVGLQSISSFTVSVEYFREAQTTLPNAPVGPVLWADFDNDDDLDALIGGSLYRNDRQNVFTPVYSGLPVGERNGVHWADYNNDGWLDLLITGNGQGSIYRNDRGTNLIDINVDLPSLTFAGAAWGDFDNDGDRDLLLTGYSGSTETTSLFRNDGQDKFFALGSAGLPRVAVAAVAWGDFDADGKLDVLLAGGFGASSVVGVYRNLGNGFFNLAWALPGARVGAVAWGDYDGNGTLDAMVAGFDNGRYLLNVYRNNGDETFSELDLDLQGIASGTAKWADFDNDGDLDIFAGGTIQNANAQWITRVYRNDGNSNFSILPTVLPQTYDTCADWGDYDGDGDLDILLCGVVGPGPQSVVGVYRNEIPSANAPPSAPTGLVSDLLPDNDVALGWNRSGDSEQASVGLGYALRVRTTAPTAEAIVFPHANPATGFRRLPEVGPASSNGWILRDLPRGSYAWSVQAIDAGLAGSVFASEGTFAITNARPTIVGLSNVVMIPNSSAGPLHFVIGDFETAAGDLLVTATSSNQFLLPTNGISLGGSGSNRTVTITPAPNRFGTGTVTITVTDVSSLSARATFMVSVEQFTRVRGFSATQGGTVAWGDHDNDDDLDLLLVGQPGARLERNDGNGVFTEVTVNQNWLSDGSAAWADFDHDGFLDFAESGNLGGGISFQGTEVNRNNGNGTFTRLMKPLLGVVYGPLAWGDYDNDGDSDLLLGGFGFYAPGYAASKVYRNDVYGQTLADTAAPLLGVGFAAGTWGDFDGDGWLDVLMAGSTNSQASAARTRLYINDRAGSFVLRQHNLPDVTRSAVAAADFDHDGDLDIALGGADTNTNRICGVFRNDGLGSFSQFAALTGVMDGSLGWGDYDSDGWPDLVVSGTTNNSPPGGVTHLFRNQAGAGFQLAPVEFPPYGFNSVAWGDYDNDGTLDLALTGGGNTGTSLYRNNQAPAANNVAAPNELTTTVTGNNVLLAWRPPPGAATLAHTYNVRLRRTTDLREIVSPNAAPTGYRRVAEAGNAGALTRKIVRGLRRGAYYWSVQTIDAGYRGSVFSTQAVFVVTNDLPPTLSPLASLAGVEDGPRLTNFLSGITAGDVAGPLTLTVTSANISLATNIQTFYTSPHSTGQIVIRLVADAFGTGDVHVAVSGLGLSGQTLATSRAFSLVIAPVNDRPVAFMQDVSGIEDSLLPITLQASDVDGDGLGFSVVQQPARGSLTGTGRELVYKPNTNYFGSDSFRFRVSDSITNSAEALVRINVSPVQDIDVVRLEMEPAGQNLVVKVQGEPYQRYAVETSENLVDWTQLQTLTASWEGLLSISIPPQSSGRRFYRTRAIVSN